MSETARYSTIPPQQVSSYVGFDTITSQIEKKLLKRGFAFNIMVVGKSGLGKSTFVNTLFASHLIESRGSSSTVEVINTTRVIEENGIFY